MKKITATREQLRIAGIILMSVVAVLYFIFIFLPLFKKAADYSRKEKELRDRLKMVEELDADKQALGKEIEVIKQRLDFYEKKLPRKVNIPEILEELVSIGKASSVNFASIEPQKIEEIKVGEAGVKKYLEIPIKLKLKAGYHEFGRFVNRIENFQRFMKVNSIKITPDVSNEKRNDISLVVSAFALGDVVTDEE